MLALKGGWFLYGREFFFMRLWYVLNGLNLGTYLSYPNLSYLLLSYPALSRLVRSRNWSSDWGMWMEMDGKLSIDDMKWILTLILYFDFWID